VVDRFLDVEDRADIAADPLAVFDADPRLRQRLRRPSTSSGRPELVEGRGRLPVRDPLAGWRIHENPQHPSGGLTPELDIEDFQVVRASDALGDRSNPFLQVEKLRNPPSNTKSGHRPTSGLAGSAGFTRSGQLEPAFESA
jgi:hypothetical protein